MSLVGFIAAVLLTSHHLHKLFRLIYFVLFSKKAGKEIKQNQKEDRVQEDFKQEHSLIIIFDYSIGKRNTKLIVWCEGKDKG